MADEELVATPGSAPATRYDQILERVFFSRYQQGVQEVPFAREEIGAICHQLGIVVPRNLGDILYNARYRTGLPVAIKETAPQDSEWVLTSTGRGQYRFELRKLLKIVADPARVETKIADATPGIIAMYSTGDEQALLAEIRYYRLIDIFTGVTCYSLQNHLRTTVPGIGQVETDELYVGVDKRGIHHVFPVQAKSKNDRIGVVQIEQDFALCAHRFANLVCQPIAAQFMEQNLIALFAFELLDGQVRISGEKHYRLVPPDQLTEADLVSYRQRPPE